MNKTINLPEGKVRRFYHDPFEVSFDDTKMEVSEDGKITLTQNGTAVTISANIAFKASSLAFSVRDGTIVVIDKEMVEFETDNEKSVVMKHDTLKKITALLDSSRKTKIINREDIPRG